MATRDPPTYHLRDIPASVWTLGFVSLLMDTSSELIHALLPIYLVATLNTSTLTVGIIEGIAEATASITKLFSGVLSDRLGKRKLLVALGYGLAAFSKPAFPLAISVGWLAAARFVDRVGKGIRGAPRDALIADIAPAHLRGASFGLRQSLDTVGAVLGPLLAIVLMRSTANNFRAAFWGAVFPAFLSLALVLFGVHEGGPRQSPAPPVRPPLHLRELRRLGPAYWWVLVISTVFTLARFSEAFLVLRAQSIGLPIALVPATMIVMNLVYAASAYPAGLLSDRLDRWTILAVGMGVLIAADVFLALPGGLVGLLVGVVLWGLHMGFTQGLLAALIADAAPAGLRGTAFGVFNLIGGIAMLAASVIAGVLWDSSGPRGTFLAGAAFAALAAVGMLWIRRKMVTPPGAGGSAAP